MKSNLEIIKPKNEAEWLALRRNNLNSTEVSALFDCNSYLTRYELWHHKKTKDVVLFQETDRMMWGKLLEPVIAEKVAETHGLIVKPLKEYYQVRDLRIGSSFDFGVFDDKGNLISFLEIKNVDYLQFKKNWIEYDDGEIEAPPYIEIQTQHQMMMLNLDSCYLCVLVGGNDLKVLKKTANQKMQEKILSACADFWNSIDSNTPPEIDYTRDSDFVIEQHGFADDDKTMYADDLANALELEQLVKDYKLAAKNEKHFENEKKAYKAKIFEIIGDSAKVKGGDWSISAGNVAASEISYTRKAFRNFKISFKKKENESDNE
jgi:putative phage-type endonuclease